MLPSPGHQPRCICALWRLAPPDQGSRRGLVMLAPAGRLQWLNAGGKWCLRVRWTQVAEIKENGRENGKFWSRNQPSTAMSQSIFCLQHWLLISISCIHTIIYLLTNIFLCCDYLSFGLVSKATGGSFLDSSSIPSILPTPAEKSTMIKKPNQKLPRSPSLDSGGITEVDSEDDFPSV